MEPSLVQASLSNQHFAFEEYNLYGNKLIVLNNNHNNNGDKIVTDVTTGQHENTTEAIYESSWCDTATSDGQTSSNGIRDKQRVSDVKGRYHMKGDPMNEQPPILSLSLGQSCLLGMKKWERQNSCQKPTSFGLEKMRCNSESVSAFDYLWLPRGRTTSKTGRLCDSNQNSETKYLVLEIISSKRYCTSVDIMKSLPAVTSPKCVSMALTDLQRKGLIQCVRTEPSTWMKVPVDQKNGVDIEMVVTESLCKGILASNTSRCLELMGDKTDGEPGVCKNRSCSSPSLEKQHSLLGFSKRPHRNTDLDCFYSERSFQPRYISNNDSFKFDSNLNLEELSTEPFPEISMNPLELTPLQQNVIDVMTQNNRPLTTLELAKQIGLTNKRVINSALYGMEKGGMIQRVMFQPPVWSLNRRKNPGVIGGERTLKEPLRRKSFNEAILSGRNRRRSEMERQAAENLKPRSRSLNCEGDSSGIKSCGLCKISFTSKQQSEEHFQSTKHHNKIAKVTSEPYLKFCDYCKVHLNSKSQATEHFTSGRHEQTVAKSQKAPIRHHPPLKTPTEGFNPQINTETIPFDYQVELYYKAMSADSVCFLPTGTGKTLVAALVVAHLLLLNPTRQIIFLVDRVILVIQQSEYLKNELRNLQIPLSVKDEGEENAIGPNGQQSILLGEVSRPVRIGAICGEMRKLEQGVPIFNHDILVVTADCYRNHINNGTLRFEDSALIVLDESHHCNKDHPYNVIVRDYYLNEDTPVFQRPKILGLTASPAGEPTLERTLKKMQRLLSNLGGASLMTVTENIPELVERTNQAEMICFCAEYTKTEESLLGVLMEYGTKCFNLAARLSEFKEYKDVFQPSAGGVLSRDDIYPILGVIDNLLNSQKSETTNAINSLMHFKIICDCICTLQECGERVAFDRILELIQGNCPHGLDWAEEQGLPCEKIKTYLQQSFIKGSGLLRHFSDMASGVAELVELLLRFQWGEKEDGKRSLALVLVKRRCTAVCLAEHLSSCQELQSKLIRTTYVIGLGNGGTDRGMTVVQQIEALKQIKQGIFQVVVTTSVAEEGLDLPACDLVVQMDPPNSVTALVQIRARARQKRAHFAAICRDKDQARKIKDLLAREENMRQAAEIINGQKL